MNVLHDEVNFKSCMIKLKTNFRDILRRLHEEKRIRVIGGESMNHILPSCSHVAKLYLASKP